MSEGPMRMQLVEQGAGEQLVVHLSAECPLCWV